MTLLGRLDESGWPNTLLPLLIILFAKQHGRAYPQAVVTEQQARVYREQTEGPAPHHVDTFVRTGAQASAALILLQLTVRQKGAVVSDGDRAMAPNNK